MRPFVGTGIVIRLFLSLVIAFSSIVNAYAITGENGQFFFRYKTGYQAGSTTPPEEEEDDLTSKTVNANFVGGIGFPLSEKLPLKPEWEDDRWQVEVGDLPEGISFNAATRTFEGTPAAAVTDVQVTLYGYDVSGSRVARAYATFDIYALPENSKYVDLYAHTAKFYNTSIDLPAGVVVDRWVELKVPPTGIDYNGRYVEGTPAEVGQYAILNIGYSYSGEPIFSYYGKLLVEDGPTFPVIADQLQEIGYYYRAAIWDDKAMDKVVRAVKDAGKVRYSAELAPDQTLPGTLRFSNDPYDLRLSGSVFDFYDQATIRLKAVDTDGAVGYSNWFRVGSLGPAGLCTPEGGSDSIVLAGVAGDSFLKDGYKIPTGRDAAVKEFTITAGQLPQGLSLGKDSGVISGVPAGEEMQTGIMVRINFPGNDLAEPVNCGPYDFNIGPAKVVLNGVGAKDHYRVGAVLDIDMEPSGGLIEPYTVTMVDGAVLPPSVSWDSTTGKLTGSLTTIGTYKAAFKLTNGNGLTDTLGIAFEVHNPLSIGALPPVASIKQYDRVNQLMAVDYDRAAVIGDAVLQLMDGPMPEGIVFSSDERIVFGGTRLSEGVYGPYYFRLNDESGEYVDTNSFNIQVTKRDGLIAGATANPVELEANLEVQGYKPFSVTQPLLAQNHLPLQYELKGPDLPEGLVFDTGTGRIEGTPKKIEAISGYSIEIREISPDNLSKTSEMFTIDVGEPKPIGLVPLAQLRGNMGGPFVASVDPTGALREIEKKLVGGVGAVTFVSSSPVVPGLALNAGTGKLEGLPTAEYEGDIEIGFHDGAGREGTMVLPVKIYPYPALQSEVIFELPRLADASDYGIHAEPANSGFYGGISWSLAPTSDPLPSGLVLNSDGALEGSTSLPKDTVRNIVVRATSKANGIVVDHAFTLKLVDRVPPTWQFPATRFSIRLNVATGEVVSRDAVVLPLYLKGSYVKPVKWTLGQNAPSWATLDEVTGVLGGTPPTIRDWDIDVIGTDAENLAIPGQVPVRSTLSGYVQMAPGSQSLVVRQSETFKTKSQTLSNVVNPAVFVAPNLPSGFTLDPVTGEMQGKIDAAKSTLWSLNIVDAHDREMYKPASFLVETLPPLKLGGPTRNEAAKRYSADQPVNIQFPVPSNQIGEITYAIEGEVPGTLYYKVVDKTTGLASFLEYSGSSYVDTVVQNAGEQLEATIARLAPDHLILDHEARTLKGIPSRSGTFPISVVAFDDHANKYLMLSDATRGEYNAAKFGPFNITVAEADEMTIVNSANSEALDEYTSAPTIRATITNDAYGRGVKWTKVSGTLPQNIDASKGAQVLAYTGYAEEQGAFNDIVWKATDMAGREIVADAVSFTVGPRKAMELVTSTGNPRNMIVFDQDADMTVSAKSAAYGPDIGIANWTVTGSENLPPGVSYQINIDGVHFSGKSDIIGTYAGITLEGRDPLGASASISLTFKVIANPEPIVLNVFDIITKPGYPIMMAPPFALGSLSTDNTYGKVRFYSYDLPQAEGINLDPDTGALSGSVASAQQFAFDLYVTDDTNRVTSKPVNVSVIPSLRLLVPSVVDGETGVNLNQTIATDYALGAVTYAKGDGTWPTGIDVNAQTGEITSTGVVTAPAGEYSGLTIVGSDRFGTYTDVQSSNPFTIKIVTNGPRIVLENAVLPDGMKRIEAYSYDFRQVTTVVNMNMSDVAWTWSASSTAGERYPTGLTFSNGILSGTPGLSGSFAFTVKAYKNGSPNTVFATKQYTLVVKLPETKLELAGGALPDAERGEAYSFDLKTLLTLKNIVATDVRWTRLTVAGQTLPSGVSLATTTGILSGTPVTSGEHTLTIQASYTNSTDENLTSNAVFTLKVKGKNYEFTKISASSMANKTCGLTDGGGVMCWGQPSVGNGTTSSAFSPVLVIASGAVDVSAGQFATCAVLQDGGVKCWGVNSNGMVGDGTNDRRDSPVDVVGLAGAAVSISAGYTHVCAVLSSGDVQCWGRNNFYQLGDGTQAERWLAGPVVPLGASAKQVVVGQYHSCALTTSGGVKCWGYNTQGQLGNNTTTTNSSPVDVNGMTSGVAQITAGSLHTCAVTTGGVAKCWGYNGYGQTGDNSTTSRSVPVNVKNLSNVSRISAGSYHTCATTGTGAAYCWGRGDDGRLGNGSAADARTPAAVLGLGSGIVGISAGGAHSCALRSDSKALCWGFNSSGQLGDATIATKYSPVLVQ